MFVITIYSVYREGNGTSGVGCNLKTRENNFHKPTFVLQEINFITVWEGMGIVICSMN